MKYFLDAEFIEDGVTIDLISIGIVADDGREYYAISNEYDASKASDWVKKNVLNQLPPRSAWPELYKSRQQIARDVIEFVRASAAKPAFYGYYADYDWVVFCQLFGTMMDLPDGFPMYCRDIKQIADMMGGVKLPEQSIGEHNALEDARWNKRAYEYLMDLQRVLEI